MPVESVVKTKATFPEVDPGAVPLGARVLVQVKTVASRTDSGLYVVEETRSEAQWNTQVAKIIALGPLAFCNRETGKPWTEGMWAQVGDYVRVPRWGGDRWEREVPGEMERARFVIVNDHEIIAKLTIDPLEMKEYIL